jgi:signal transduction histidine kinase/ActR/RegA family two-component response regulator
VIAFVMFFGCAVVELLVANRVIRFLSTADVGFVVVVVPLTVRLVRQVVADAKRLEALSGRLADEVKQRTEERDRAEEALVEAERLAALGRLAAGVGHEINNPLTNMQLALDELESEIGHRGAASASGRALASVREGAWRIQKVVEGLRSYSRNQEGHEPVDLCDVVRAALRIAGPRLRHVAHVESDLSPVPTVIGDEPRLVQALVNLLTNADQAVAERGSEGQIAVRTGTDPEGWAIVSVADNGAGISPDHLARLSEPYFTTRGRLGGLGLGLFVTRGIVDAHGGRLEIQSQDGRGTTATIALPPPSRPAVIEVSGSARESEPARLSPAPPVVVAEEAAAKPGCARMAAPAVSASIEVVGAATASPPPAPLPVELSRVPPVALDAGGVPAAGGDTKGPAAPASDRRLLLMDDEPMVCEFLARALGRRWQVTAVQDGHSALDALQAGGFDAVVCDLMMPGISGIELGQRIEAGWPALWPRVVCLTGGAITPDAEQFLGRPDVRRLVKPVQIGALEATLEAVVAASTDSWPGL